MLRAAKTIQELEVYTKAFALQQTIFGLSKAFPKEESYSLTDQIRRSSRAVGANLAEAWRKRAYEAHFVSKLSDADAELSETLHWLRTAHACSYLAAEQLRVLEALGSEIGAMLEGMIHTSASWCQTSRPRREST